MSHARFEAVKAIAAGATSIAGTELLSAMISGTNDLYRDTAALETAATHPGDGDASAHARHTKEHITSAMLALRGVVDKLEAIIPDDIWPLPTYRKMLFIK